MIIAFAGRKQSGKTTCSEFVASRFSGNAKIYNFADPLKTDICMNIFGLTHAQCYGSDDDKNQIVNCYWPGTKNPMTAREVMQYVGTDIFRKIQTNVWADATIIKILKEQADLSLIADCRFPNEVEVVQKAGGYVIKLMRNIYNSDHDSETALDENKFDHNKFDLVVDNRKLNIDQQNAVILSFLQNKGILPL